MLVEVIAQNSVHKNRPNVHAVCAGNRLENAEHIFSALRRLQTRLEEAKAGTSNADLDTNGPTQSEGPDQEADGGIQSSQPSHYPADISWPFCVKMHNFCVT